MMVEIVATFAEVGAEQSPEVSEVCRFSEDARVNVTPRVYGMLHPGRNYAL
jgi:hypothetical protein